MATRVLVSLAVGTAAVLSAVSVGHGAPGREGVQAPAAAPEGGLIAYTVIRSAQQVFEASIAKRSVKRLRRNDAVEYEPSVSPNGHRLLFVSTLAGGADIYISGRNGSGQRRLTTAPQADYDPSWSATGARIAWVRERNGRGEIWVMAADGSGQRRLVAGRDAQNPSWAPDGKHIAFWDARQEVVYSVPSAGGPSKRLTRGWHPAWSPDGTRIALTRDVGGASTLILYDVASLKARALFADPEADDAWPSWSPDGKRIAFQRFGYGTYASDIWVAGADGKGARRVVATWADEANPQFTPDGKHLTFTSNSAADSDIAVANVDGTNERIVVTGSAWDNDPSWSPDGTALAFVSDGPGNVPVLSRSATPTPAGPAATLNWDVYLVRPDGTGFKRLTRSPADDLRPAFGPGVIAFESDRSGDREIWTMAADGSDATQVTRHEGWDGDPDWSPDGTQIVYASERGGDTEIFVTSADGRDMIQVTRNDEDDDGPAWSPDGTRLVFARFTDGHWSIFVAESDGSNVRRVTRSPGADEYPEWSADGKWILFSRSTGDLVQQIVRVRPDGSGLAPVTSGRIPSWLPSAFALASPDQ